MSAFPIAEILRRAQLQNQLGITGGQAIAPVASQAGDQGQVQSQQPQVQAPPTQAPVQSERDKALGSYRDALNSPAPIYNPSIGRRVIAGLLGGITGVTNPQAGKELAQGIAQAPYNKQLSQYQQKLAQKKAAFELESGSEAEQAKTEEQRAQKEAEVSRAGAEEARRLGEKWKISPEGQAFEIRKLQVQHPNNKLPTPYSLILKNDEKVVAFEDQNGQFKDSDGNIYGPDSIKAAYKIGSEPKAGATKPEREGEAGAIDQWEKEHGRAPNYSERVAIHRQYSEKPVDTTGRDISNEFKLQTARNAAARPFERSRDLATAQLDRIDRGTEEVSSTKPTDLALSIPTILTALVSGQGTGVRITQAEMNSIIHARGFGDSIQAFGNKLAGLGNLSDKQKNDLKGLLSDVKKKVEQRQKEASDTADEIYDANDVKAINAARVKYNKSLTQGNQDNTLPGGVTLDEINAEIERRKKAK